MNSNMFILNLNKNKSALLNQFYLNFSKQIAIFLIIFLLLPFANAVYSETVSEEELDYYVSMLSNERAKVRKSAIIELAKIGGSKAEVALNDLWNDEIYNFFQINSFHTSVRKPPLYILVNMIYRALVPNSLLYSHNLLK